MGTNSSASASTSATAAAVAEGPGPGAAGVRDRGGCALAACFKHAHVVRQQCEQFRRHPLW
eukprot:scaffold94495_cov18-Phaeocystis_antarctica.AAC.1